jgi:hypothetical protein
MFKTMTVALAGLGLAMAACGGDTTAAKEPTDAGDIPVAGPIIEEFSGGEFPTTTTEIVADNTSNVTEEQCLALLQVTDEALEVPQISACRLAGHDPLWNAVGIFVADLDYEVWRETGYVPTCDSLLGTSNPLGGLYKAEDVAQCKELR